MNRAILIAALLAGCTAEGGAPGANGQEGNAADNQVSGPIGPRGGPCVGPLSLSAFENCDFGPAARMRGVWVTGFEQSGFVPDATAAPHYGDPTRGRIWLAFAPGSPPDPALRAELDKLATTGAVAIDFVGRRSRERGGDGRVIVVDRIISARVLGPLRRP